jgi:hypothetical protein
MKDTPGAEEFKASKGCIGYMIKGAVYATFQKNNIDTTVSTFVHWLLTLHVLTLMLGHHQAYNNTSISS